MSDAQREALAAQFNDWWSGYWQNRTDTFEHTATRMVARDAWWHAVDNVAARPSCPAVSAEVERILDEAKAWKPYESRDTGSVYLSEVVDDLLADLRAALADPV